MHHQHEHVYRFCPICGGNLEPKLIKPTDPVRLVCSSCDFIFYLDPKVAVGTIIRMPDQRIVLVRRAIEPGYGRWVFPSGYVDRGEHIHVAALREAKEESGLDVAIDGLVNIYSYAGRAPVIIVYAATMVSGEISIDEESSEAAVFNISNIPWNSLAFSSTMDALRDYFSGVLHPVPSARTSLRQSD